MLTQFSERNYCSERGDTEKCPCGSVWNRWWGGYVCEALIPTGVGYLI